MQQNMEEIYKKHYSTVYKYLFCLTRDNDTSEDLAQETFYRAVKYIETFRDSSKISIWLCKIAKNIWYDELRKKKMKIADGEIEEIASKQNMEEDYINKEEILKIYKAIDKLNKKTKKVMYLRLEEDMDFKQIGEILGKNETWARVTFYRGKQKIKEGLL